MSSFADNPVPDEDNYRYLVSDPQLGASLVGVFDTLPQAEAFQARYWTQKMANRGSMGDSAFWSSMKPTVRRVDQGADGVTGRVVNDGSALLIPDTVLTPEQSAERHQKWHDDRLKADCKVDTIPPSTPWSFRLYECSGDYSRCYGSDVLDDKGLRLRCELQSYMAHMLSVTGQVSESQQSQTDLVVTEVLMLCQTTLATVTRLVHTAWANEDVLLVLALQRTRAEGSTVI